MRICIQRIIYKNNFEYPRKMPQSAEVIRKKIKAELNLQLLNCPIISGKWARRGTKTRAKAQRHGHLAGSVSEASLRSGGVRSGSWRARLVVR